MTVVQSFRSLYKRTPLSESLPLQPVGFAMSSTTRACSVMTTLTGANDLFAMTRILIARLVSCYSPTPLSMGSPTSMLDVHDPFASALKTSPNSPNNGSSNPATLLNHSFANASYSNTLNLSQAMNSFQPQQVLLTAHTINPQQSQQPPQMHHQHQYIGLPQPSVRVNAPHMTPEVQVMERSGLDDVQDAPIYPSRASCSKCVHTCLRFFLEVAENFPRNVSNKRLRFLFLVSPSILAMYRNGVPSPGWRRRSRWTLTS